MSRIVDDDPPIKTHPASNEYRANYDRIFGDASGSSQDVEARQVAPVPEAAADSDAIEITLKSYANFIVPLEAPDDPPSIEIGWECPCCLERGPRICFIDREARIFKCEFVHNEDAVEHSFDDVL